MKQRIPALNSNIIKRTDLTIKKNNMKLLLNRIQ